MPRHKPSSFEDRLARLKDSLDQASPPPGPPPPPPAPSANRTSRDVPAAQEQAAPPEPASGPAPNRKRPMARIVFAAGLGLMAGGILTLPRDALSLPQVPAEVADLVPAVLRPTLSGPVPVAATVAAPAMVETPAPVPMAAPGPVLVAADPPAAAAAAPALLDRVMALLTGAPAEPAPPRTLPAEFLPAAPTDWVRITEADAAAPNALDRLGVEWAQIPGAVPLAEHGGYGQLKLFLTSPPVTPEQARMRTQAVYLAGTGEYLSVVVKFRMASAAFGPPGDSMAWQQALRAEVRRTTGPSEVVEPLTLGGIAMFNRTRPTGKSPTSRPVGKDLEVPNGLKLTAALSHRIEVQANGHTTPKAAGALIAAFDRKGLAAIP